MPRLAGRGDNTAQGEIGVLLQLVALGDRCTGAHGVIHDAAGGREYEAGNGERDQQFRDREAVSCSC